MHLFRRCIFISFFALTLPVQAQNDPTLMARGSGVFIDNIVINSSGGVYFVTFTAVHFQDGSSTALNPILTAGDMIFGSTLDSIPPSFRRPLMPMFYTDYVLFRGSFNGMTEERILMLNPQGTILDQFSSTDPVLSGFSQPRFSLQNGAMDPTTQPGRNAVFVEGPAYTGAFVYEADSMATPMTGYVSRFYNNFAVQSELVDLAFDPDAVRLVSNNLQFSVVPFNIGVQIIGPNDPVTPGTDMDDKMMGVRLFGYGMGGHSGVLMTSEFAALSCPFTVTDGWSGDPLTRTDPFIYETVPINYSVSLVAGNWIDEVMSPRDFVAIGTIATNGQEPQAAGSASCDCDKADIDGDGTIGDVDDRTALWRCIVTGCTDPDLDLNGDGKWNSDDELCFDECNNGGGVAAGVDPGFTNPMEVITIFEVGDPLPGAPGYVMVGITGVRGNADGVAVFTVNGNGPGGFDTFLYLLDDNGLQLILKEGDDLGDGVINGISPPSNVNEHGQFAVRVLFQDNSNGVYRFQGNPPPPPESSVREGWERYNSTN